MITLKTLKWSNLFSYGSDNVIDFSANPITQLIGKNGHGKSSIALVLEECLFNKNSKGIKKADILNRHGKVKSYSISLTFEKDGNVYEIQTTRGSSQTVIFLCNGDNVSAHTATATFSLIEEILGFDHKTFAQLVYQSSGSSLEFLTATDTNRKKFLIDLLNLSRYIEAHEHFKQAAKAVELDIASVSSKIKTTEAWVEKNKSLDMAPLTPKGLPFSEIDLNKLLTEREQQLRNIDATNKRIAKNNIQVKQLNAIDPSDLAKSVPEDIDGSRELNQIGGYQRVVKDADAFIAKIGKLNGVCPTCLQEVDRTKLDELVAEQETLKKSASDAITKLNATISVKSQNSTEARRLDKVRQEWEFLNSQIDPKLPSDTVDGNALEAEISSLRQTIEKIDLETRAVIEYNNKVHAHNSKIQVVTEQMQSMQVDLAKYSEELAQLSEKVSILQILQKTFSTNGLIAYKIECLVKDLEELANQYLSELSSGRFQLTFKVSAGDKLNVIITDNGKDIDILALSGGERARVNTATLLAIRKLMQSLSNARLNLLILDETIDSLDIDGKEKLVEVLLKEEHLNTFLISHGFTHPLLEKITVIKEHNISRLE